MSRLTALWKARESHLRLSFGLAAETVEESGGSRQVRSAVVAAASRAGEKGITLLAS